MCENNRLSGYLVLKLDDKSSIRIEARDFSCAEAGRRHLGDSEYQYEWLYIYTDDDREIDLSIEGAVFLNDDGSPSDSARTYDVENLGAGEVEEDELLFNVCYEEIFDDD